ncbi:MAG: hypothetical protein ACLU6Y_08990 [Ruminococcus sp.]
MIIRTDHEIIKRITYERTCVKNIRIMAKYDTETKYIYTRKGKKRSRFIVIPGVPVKSENTMPRAVRTVHMCTFLRWDRGVRMPPEVADIKKMDPMSDLFTKHWMRRLC